MAPAFILWVGLLILYAPTAWDLSHGLWRDDAHSHGPLVLVATVWLFVRGMRAHAASGGKGSSATSRRCGWIALLLGLSLYALGRSQGLFVLEVGSAIPVVLGVVLIGHGQALARHLWFAFVFMVFLIPLPGSLIDLLTQPMKIAVSYAAELFMHAAGYPVARQGVILAIGPYQLFVADACAGLNSLFMLEAFGLLYLNVIRHESMLRNAALAILIVPISFTANVLRVVILALVTFHYGDAAGQGFIHSLSGVVLFAVALVLTLAADAMMRTVAARLPGGRAARPLPEEPARRSAQVKSSLSPSAAIAITAASAAAAAIAIVLAAPQQSADALPSLSGTIPAEFGEWRVVNTSFVPVDLVAAIPGQTTMDKPYDDAVMRTYANSSGLVVAVAVAYAANQRQEVKIHRPDLCYIGQGFSIKSLATKSFGPLGDSGESVVGKRMYAESAQGNEAVSYWIRIGEIYSEDAWATRLHIFRQGLKGLSTDGALVRVSRVVRDEKEAGESYAVLEAFARELVHATPPRTRTLLAR